VYRKKQDLINIGAYSSGSNPAIDQAIALHEPLDRFLRQGVTEGFTAAQSWSLLEKALSLPTPPGKTTPVNK
jgi:flagellum-specific ATP synthase